jgi:hypothetical protein
MKKHGPSCLGHVAVRTVWQRRVPKGWVGRLNVYRNTLRDERIKLAVIYVAAGRAIAVMPMEELRRALAGNNPNRRVKCCSRLTPRGAQVNGPPVTMWVRADCPRLDEVA